MKLYFATVQISYELLCVSELSQCCISGSCQIDFVTVLVTALAATQRDHWQHHIPLQILLLTRGVIPHRTL